MGHVLKNIRGEFASSFRVNMKFEMVNLPGSRFNQNKQTTIVGGSAASWMQNLIPGKLK